MYQTYDAATLAVVAITKSTRDHTLKAIWENSKLQQSQSQTQCFQLNEQSVVCLFVSSACPFLCTYIYYYSYIHMYVCAVL